MMKHPGEDIRYVRDIFHFIYGEQETYKEVNVSRWMKEADKLVKELRVSSYKEAFGKLMEIPYNVLQL